MNSDYTFRVLSTDDVGQFRSLRSAGLEDEPAAFGQTAGEFNRMGTVELEAWIGPNDDRFIMGAFACDGSLIGTVGLRRDGRERVRHKATLWGVYVLPLHRGMGVARSLMLESFERALAIDGLMQLQLCVAVSQVAAHRLYHSLGFIEFGREPRGLKMGDGYVDEIHMWLALPPRSRKARRVGVQGEAGSACDEAAVALTETDGEFVYLTDADRTLAALAAGEIDFAVLAVESPLGVRVEETSRALAGTPVEEVGELRSEVRHCIMARYGATRIRALASHPIPLKKHRDYLMARFPGYETIEVADPGLAAKQLADGTLAADVAVIAMPRAAELFGLQVIESELPANDRYLTRFVLVQRANG